MNDSPETSQLLTADGTGIRPGLYLKDGRTLYKVSTLYASCVTLQVCWEHGAGLSRTTVRTAANSAVAAMTVATGRMIRRYHDFLDGKPNKPRVHDFEQDPEKMPGACKFRGLDDRNPTHKTGTRTI
jgi:hypothetical protein